MRSWIWVRTLGSSRKSDERLAEEPLGTARRELSARLASPSRGGTDRFISVFSSDWLLALTAVLSTLALGSFEPGRSRAERATFFWPAMTDFGGWPAFEGR